MCSTGRKISEIGRSLAHHLQMMCRRNGENDFRARVCASNAIHPAMMCSSGGEKPENRPARCTSSVDGVHDMRRKELKRKGSCISLSTSHTTVPTQACVSAGGVCVCVAECNASNTIALYRGKCPLPSTPTAATRCCCPSRCWRPASFFGASFRWCSSPVREIRNKSEIEKGGRSS